MRITAFQAIFALSSFAMSNGKEPADLVNHLNSIFGMHTQFGMRMRPDGFNTLEEALRFFVINYVKYP